MRPDVRIAGARVQLRTIDSNNLMVLLDFRRKLAAGEGGQVCTGPNVAHPSATDGSDGALGDADEPGASPEPDAAEPEGVPMQRRCTAPATSVGRSRHKARATLIRPVAKTTGGPRLLWELFDDGGTALTAALVTLREQPPGGVRWSCC